MGLVEMAHSSAGTEPVKSFSPSRAIDRLVMAPVVVGIVALNMF